MHIFEDLNYALDVLLYRHYMYTRARDQLNTKQLLNWAPAYWIGHATWTEPRENWQELQEAWLEYLDDNKIERYNRPWAIASVNSHNTEELD